MCSAAGSRVDCSELKCAHSSISDMLPSTGRALRVLAVALRSRQHAPGAGFAERTAIYSGVSPGDRAGLSIADHEPPASGPLRIEGGFSGEGNMDADPLFLADGDYHLGPDSPCIDAGDPTDDPGPEPTPHGDRINLGAYGGTIQAACSPGS